MASHFKAAISQMRTNPGQYKHAIGPIGVETHRSGASLYTAVHRPGRETQVYNKRASSLGGAAKMGRTSHAIQSISYHHTVDHGAVGNAIAAHPGATIAGAAGVVAAGYGAHKLYQHFQHRPVAPMHEKAASTFHATHAGLA